MTHAARGHGSHAFDPATLPPARRTALITIGRHYGSSDTLAQAEVTLNAYTPVAAALAAHGFIAADATRLRAAHDALIAAGVTRDTVRAGKKVTRREFVAALQAGKRARLRARNVLVAVRRVLADHADAASAAAVLKLDAGLDTTRSAGSDPAALAGQLDALHTLLTHAAVAPSAHDRGGPDAARALTEAAASLRAETAHAATGAGTPSETEALDLLDGIVVELARAARAAARAAAREAGTPALASAFELSALHPHHHAPPAPPAGGSAPATPPATPAAT